MRAISRRDALVGAAAVVAAASLPTIVPTIEAASVVEVIPAWAVGTAGEFDWQHVVGRSADEAIRNFMCEMIGGDGCEEGNDPACDCEWCSTIGGLEVERVKIWDGLQSTSAADWLRAGMGTICSRCSEETFRDEGAHPIKDEAVCADCMTLADWDIVDPERAAELRTKRSLTSGEGKV